jgi:RNA polymerase sigma factor (sigma-70 family)
MADRRADALEDLYRERYATFRDVLAGVIGDYDAAREVVQEAFARALRARRTYRGEGTLEAWVWKIAVRLAWKSTRTRRRPIDPPAVAVAAATNGTADPDVLDALRRLAPKRRLVVFLRYYADLSYAEIAAACGIAEGTVAATLAQARVELAAALEGKELPR